VTSVTVPQFNKKLFPTGCGYVFTDANIKQMPVLFTSHKSTWFVVWANWVTFPCRSSRYPRADGSSPPWPWLRNSFIHCALCQLL